jgi:hypothetical protein
MRKHRCNIVGPALPGLPLGGGPRRHPSPGGLGWGGLAPGRPCEVRGLRTGPAAHRTARCFAPPPGAPEVSCSDYYAPRLDPSAFARNWGHMSGVLNLKHRPCAERLHHTTTSFGTSWGRLWGYRVKTGAKGRAKPGRSRLVSVSETEKTAMVTGGRWSNRRTSMVLFSESASQYSVTPTAA